MLDADARKHVLREPLNEIVRMLEQNLLAKFRRSVALQKGGRASFFSDKHVHANAVKRRLSSPKSPRRTLTGANADGPVAVRRAHDAIMFERLKWKRLHTVARA